MVQHKYKSVANKQIFNRHLLAGERILRPARWDPEAGPLSALVSGEGVKT